MSWLPPGVADLLKHLQVRRIAVFAVLAAALVVLAGPVLIPQYLPTLAPAYRSGVMAVAVATGVLTAAWTVQGFWLAGRFLVSLLATSWRISRLPVPEQRLLWWIGQMAPRPMHLERGPLYPGAPSTYLGMCNLVRNLDHLGLIERNPFDRDLVTLTVKGLDFVLRMHAKVGIST